MTTATLARRHAQLRRHTGRLTRELAHARLREAEARHAATHDPLTGALNRLGLAEAWQACRPSGLLLFDLDGFKPVNDQHGHAAGDHVLTTVAARLTATDTATARLGGDEFAVLTSGDPADRAETLRDLIAAPIGIRPGLTVRVSASVGVRPCDQPVELHQALADADHAMYTAKTTPSGPAVMWTPDLTRPDMVAGDRLRDRHPNHHQHDDRARGPVVDSGPPHPNHPPSTSELERRTPMTDTDVSDPATGDLTRQPATASDDHATPDAATSRAEQHPSATRDDDDGWQL